MKFILIFFINIYRWTISPFLGQNCRYYPTCSAYGKEAIKKHGAVKGGWLALKRFLRCHPWSKHPFDDPVP